MASVVKGMDRAMESMNLEKVCRKWPRRGRDESGRGFWCNFSGTDIYGDG